MHNLYFCTTTLLHEGLQTFTTNILLQNQLKLFLIFVLHLAKQVSVKDSYINLNSLIIVMLVMLVYVSQHKTF